MTPADPFPRARSQPRAGPRPARPSAGSGGGWLLAAILLAALNLRGAIAAVAPVLPELRAELGLTPTTAGLLTTLPVLCFAALAPASAWLGRVVGPRAAVLGGLVAIAVGSVLRVLDGPVVLLAGTFVVGAAMTIGNVLLPVVVKAEFPERAGMVTGLYTGTLAGGAGLTIALTAPVAAVWGWRTGLGVWSLLAVAAAVLWLVATGRRGSTVAQRPSGAAGGSAGTVWRSPVAWAAAVLLAMQSALYYSFTTWLPSMLVDEAALSLQTASFAAAVFQALGIPGALLVPLVLGRLRTQRGLAVVTASAWGLVPLGLLVQPGLWPVWVGVGGLVQGTGVSLAFALVALRGADEDAVRRLSAMTQLVGYSVGAVGPLVVGGLFAASAGWTAPFGLLVLVAVVYAVAGSVAGRPVRVGG